MVLCNVEYLQNISNYLDVPPMQLEMHENVPVAKEENSDLKIEGFSSIIHSFIKNLKYHDILGCDKEVEALTYQWLEYVVVCVNHADTPAIAERVLKELDMALAHKTYITGTRKTVADVSLYYALHSVMQKLMKNRERAPLVHVSRWFDNMQQEDKLRQKLEYISFDLINLFLCSFVKTSARI